MYLFPNGDTVFAEAEIFTGAIGGSAFGRLVPSQTVHIATTFNAIGFLNQRPNTKLPHYILPMGPGPRAPRTGVSVTDAEREPFRLQAADDLHQFYRMRRQELVSGGKLLVQVFGRDQENSTSYGIYDVLNDALLDLVETGGVARESYEALVFPIYFRTLDELLAPIRYHTDLAKAFRVEFAESREVLVPFNEALAAGGSSASWADAYAGFLRVFTEAILAEALAADLTRTDTLNAIYDRVRARLIVDPDRYQFHYISVGALLTRL